MRKRFWGMNKDILARILPFLAVICLAFGLRVYNLDKVPASLYVDEVDLAYQGRSLAETGKDYFGKQSPFYSFSYNSQRTPLPSLWTMFGYKYFRIPELQTRLPFALTGVAAVALAGTIVYLVTKSRLAAWLTTLTVAISPWQIQFSRIAFEAMVVEWFYLLAVLGLVVFIVKGKNWGWWLATISMSFGIYTYRTMSLLVPISFLAIFVVFYREILALGWRKIFLSGLLVGGITIPFLYSTTIGAADQLRINQISIFSDAKVPIWVMRNREIDADELNNPVIGNQPKWWSIIFHNKLNSWLDAFGKNYIRAFSGEFLLNNGDPIPRHSVGQIGELLLVEVIPLIVGLVWIGKKWKNKFYRWLLIWLLISPIPASLTSDGGYHASRLFVMSLPLLLIIALGWWRIFLSKYVFGFMLFGFLGINFVFYYHRYLVHYPIESARAFNYGFKQVVHKIVEIQDEYKGVVLIDSEPPLIHYFFWANTDPREVQSFGWKTGDKGEVVFGKIRTINWEREVGDKTADEFLEPETLYLLTDREIPKISKGIKLIEKFVYPDKGTAYYLVSKEIKENKGF